MEDRDRGTGTDGEIFLRNLRQPMTLNYCEVEDRDRGTGTDVDVFSRNLRQPLTPEQNEPSLFEIVEAKEKEKARKKLQRERETPEGKNIRLEKQRKRTASLRDQESPETKKMRLKKQRERTASLRKQETPEKKNARLEATRNRKQQIRQRKEQRRDEERPDDFNEQPRDEGRSHFVNEQLRDQERPDDFNEQPTDEERPNLLDDQLTDEEEERSNLLRNMANNPKKWVSKENSAFRYDPAISYESDNIVVIGDMSAVCTHCQALKFKGESAGMCCNNGKIKLDLLPDPPEPLMSILAGTHPKSDDFLKLARTYNSAFQMTSFGASIVEEKNFMPTFKVQGQIYHRIGSLLPTTAQDSKFLQIYFMGDEQAEIQQRSKTFPILDSTLITDLQRMLHSHNNYVKGFKTAIEKQTTDNFKLIIKENKNPSQGHKGQYNAPTVNEVAILIVGQEFNKRDIILHSRDDKLQRISELHRSYDALQYPLMFCSGEDGYNIYIPQQDVKSGQPNLKKKVSAMDFYSYRLMIRLNSINHLLMYRQLSNQFWVDMYGKIETERLSYIRHNQAKLRVENYIHLKDAINNDGDAQNAGQLVILPSSFTGGPRYMHERTQDAMVYARKYGTPDLFITFTCNPKWSEISSNSGRKQAPRDRHDLICRVFKLKVNQLMDLINKKKIFGPTRCFMYTIEWQKRGLPHAHILVWLKNKISPNEIDAFISAELPDPDKDPVLFEIIKNNMIHGPCGILNPNSPCMQDRKCTKKYPRPFVRETKTGEDGYPTYRRRSPEDGGFKTQIKSRGKTFDVDNRWVVPYCPLLSKIFQAHINVEFCNSIKSIKYVCKYINKGSDQATFGVLQKNDEIQKFQNGRYISTSEAIWRILSFPIHERYPAVIHLSVHLENGQRVYFTDKNVHQKLEAPPPTTLTAFFELCKQDDFAKTLFYHEIPSYYTWDGKKFNRRKQGELIPDYPGIRKDNALGRVYTVHPNNAECYFLRLLLHKVKGPTSFDYLKQVDGSQCTTYQSACKALGLLENDNHWEETLKEASASQVPAMIRDLFVTILAFCFVTDPLSLWNKYKEFMSEDILHRLQKQCPQARLEYNEDIFNESLILIDDKLLTIVNKSVKDYGLPLPDRTARCQVNREYLRETSYDVDELKQYLEENEKKLLPEQRNAYELILKSVEEKKGGFFFLDAPGGTGKTFLINLLLSKIRSNKEIALAVASSGIASTLLQGGRTAHSAFKLPLNINYSENPVCNVKKNTNLAKVIADCAVIIWDEATMSHKKSIEALNRTLQDLTGLDQLMGGKTVVLSGDFRQTLPVIQRGTRADEVDASIKSSYLFRNIQTLTLSVNMRVHLKGDAEAGEFAKLLLEIGDGKIAETDNEIDLANIGNVVSTLEDLIDNVYPNLSDLTTTPQSQAWLCERAILTPKNDTAYEINECLLNRFAGEEHEYISIDTAMDDEGSVSYPVELLNTLNPSGFPSHKLKLKIGSPIMLLRNLDAPRLCNGTRLQVIDLKPHLIQATVLTGCAKGENVFIPRIPFIPNDYVIPFKRLQFPIKLCFAMTINKAQGQSFSITGVDLRQPCFSHGQLYVACSRSSDKKKLYLLTPNGKTPNIVYKEALL